MYRMSNKYNINTLTLRISEVLLTVIAIMSMTSLILSVYVNKQLCYLNARIILTVYLVAWFWHYRNQKACKASSLTSISLSNSLSGFIYYTANVWNLDLHSLKIQAFFCYASFTNERKPCVYALTSNVMMYVLCRPFVVSEKCINLCLFSAIFIFAPITVSSRVSVIITSCDIVHTWKISF